MKKIDRQETMQALSTIRDFLRWAITQFNQHELYFGHGTDNAWDEAVSLVLYSLNLPMNINPNLLDAKLTEGERSHLLDLLINRIEKRIPAAYLMHKAWFAGLEFYVDERVMIPRSPIAELIEHGFAPWINPDEVHRILDLCTGSACIPIASAYALPQANIDAVDISLDALEVARKNVSQHNVADRVQLFHSDLYAAVQQQTYDVIVSNPPYVDAEDMAALPSEYRHEPEQAFAAGDDGLDIVTRILAQATQHLSEQGILIVEVGNSVDALLQKYPELPFTWLEFERGGDGIFLLTAQQLKDAGY